MPEKIGNNRQSSNHKNVLACSNAGQQSTNDGGV